MISWRKILATAMTGVMAVIPAATAAAASGPGGGTVSPLIVGGVRALEGEYGFMVSLSVGCGGSLDSPTIVLTAAHCVGPTGPTSSIVATLGSVDLQSPNRIVVRSNYVYRAPGYVEAHHPKRASHDGDDWALARLSRPVTTLPGLSITTTNWYDEGTFLVAGWGVTASGGMNPQRYLLKTNVPFVDDATCNSPRMYDGGVLPDEEICAGRPAGGADSCQGDSGGPLFRRDVDKYFVQVGIVSWGEGCAQADRPGVHTQISQFAGQIQWAAASLS